ncbi:lamin tail domain-containing protein [Flavobacterium piscinae]|uniref:lamin tail domain-containing protein n=1 Tax=Flavobacterium piscinae TaxID=2506424 RepID=UPI0019BE83D8|nr:lamin tail domain-containing protein [Flavobacterium piscinae]MBC8884204.1 lamin tail domain-containing protein [Flavobacterium piscinae]
MRLTVSGATNSTGNNRLDNFVINASAIVSGPTVTTTATTAIATTSADLNGAINANGTTTDASFEYGTTVTYGNSITATPSTATGTSDTSISATIGSLAVNTLYHYRAVGTVSAVSTNGSDMTFYTLANTPGVVVVTNPLQTTLDVTVDATTENSNPATTEYAIQETGGQYVQGDGSLGATAVWQTVATWSTITVTGLTTSTTYTFQVKARNGANVETGFGSTESGTTLAAQLVDYAVVQFPNTTQNILEGGSLTVYIRAYEPGLTTLSGEQSNLFGWVGYSSTDDDPSNPGWTWVPATFNTEYGNDDEYQATLSSLPIGTYYYAGRFQIGTGPFVYAGSGGNWNNDNVTLNVNADVVNFANIQFPTSATLTEGETVTVFAQVYEPGVTEGAGQGAGITAEIGYSSTDTTPDGTWTWLSASHNASVTGNNDEYQVNLGTGLTPGTYYYASRFIKTGSSTYVYGGTNGSPWASSGVLTVNALGTPTATAGTLIGQTEFTANWEAVAGATSYEIDVYEQTTIFATDLFISEYIEGSSSNKYIEIYNGTGVTIDLSDYELRLYANGASTPTNANVLSGNLANGATIVYRNSAASVYGGTTTVDSAVNFNGDDAVALYKISTTSFVDIFGEIGNDPGASWSDSGNITVNQTLVRNSDIIGGVTTNPTGFPTLGTDWTSSSIDTVTDLGSHTFDGGSSTTYVIEDINVGNVTSYVVTGLNPETTYYYVVRAVLGAATSGNSNEITVITKPTTVTWNGTEWSNIDGPDATIDAIIAGAYESGTDGEFTAKSLTVESGSFTVSSGTNVTVVNEVTNELTATEFVVENNANLVQNNDTNNSGNITVNRNSSALMRLDYTLWSSPVAGQNLLDFSPLTLANRFYVYNPSNNQYATVTPSTTDFAEGTGYLIRMPDTHPTSPTVWSGSFVGVPYNGDVTISVANNTYNAVGNPYPSTIDADDFINGNSLSEALYFWRKTNAKTGSAYATYTLAGGAGTGGSGSSAQIPNGIIQVGQGFIARSTSTSLTFTNGMRTANQDNQFFRNANEEKNRIWLNLSNAQDIVGQTMIAYMENSSLEFDAMYDGKYINDSQTAFTSLINSEEFAVQARGSFSATDVVPMNFKTETAGSYTISLANVDGLFETEEDIFIKDNLLGIEHNLRNSAYAFTAEAGVFADRFEIVYESTLSLDNPTFNNVVVFSKNKSLEINAGSETISAITVFDIRGRKVASQEELNTSVASIDLTGLASQVLIVQIKMTNGQLMTKKVVH